MGDGLAGGRFFVAGGTLAADAPSYVHRTADDLLMHAIQAGEFCYVLSARQMGKSSLMVRAKDNLESQGVNTAVVDVTAIGTDLRPEQWYLGLLTSLAQQLSLATNPQRWWINHGSLGPVQRFGDFLPNVILKERGGKTVVFIDEIDSTLKLGFSDDFFAAIRAIYNKRATEPAFNRLTFVLLGVATPSELIKDSRRTPFNIGTEIELNEFSWEEALVLYRTLESAFPQRGEAIFRRIFYWTNGHPYLTQKLCDHAMHNMRSSQRLDSLVDMWVDQIFLSEDAAASERNLQFIRSKIDGSPDRKALVTLYGQVHKGKRVPEDRRSQAQNLLKLFALVRIENGLLKVRNNLYRQAFDQKWVRSYLPVNRARQTLAITGAVLLMLVAFLFVWELASTAGPIDRISGAYYVSQFEGATNTTDKFIGLSSLLNMDDERYHKKAIQFFLSLPVYEQLTVVVLFAQHSDDALINLAVHVLPELEDTLEHNEVLLILYEYLGQCSATSPTCAEMAQQLRPILVERGNIPP